MNLNPKIVYAREYAAWTNIRTRAKTRRGAKLVPDWDNSFENFLNQMGTAERISGSIAIQRLDFSKPFGPGNAMWGEANVVRGYNRIALMKNLSHPNEAAAFSKMLRKMDFDIAMDELRGMKSVLDYRDE